jgi:nucleoside-diphosphate-sugar epimerase
VSPEEKKPRQVHLLGCGDLGTRIGAALLARGDAPLALRRHVSALPQELPALAVDYTDPASLVQLAGRQADITLLTPTPPGRDVESYRLGYLAPVQNLLELWCDGPAMDLVYVSSSRVYGDAGGEWVDENSPLQPADGQAEVLAEAERLLLDSPHRVSVVRFSGIYGRLPSRLLERIKRGQIVKRSPARYSNRIHREDSIGFLLHLLDRSDRERLYLASDDSPALQYDVESWLAARLGVEQTTESVEPVAGNRRCSNARMRETGYRLLFPEYRAGYNTMITSTSMSAPLGSAAT